MNIHDRLRYLREELPLTTRVFGANINMSGGAITNMEKGTRNITDRTIRDICREYHVNINWLLHGIDPMFEPSSDSSDVSDDIQQISAQYALLSDSDRNLINQLINSLAEKNST